MELGSSSPAEPGRSSLGETRHKRGGSARDRKGSFGKEKGEEVQQGTEGEVQASQRRQSFDSIPSRQKAFRGYTHSFCFWAQVKLREHEAEACAWQRDRRGGSGMGHLSLALGPSPRPALLPKGGS